MNPKRWIVGPALVALLAAGGVLSRAHPSG